MTRHCCTGVGGFAAEFVGEIWMRFDFQHEDARSRRDRFQGNGFDCAKDPCIVWRTRAATAASSEPQTHITMAKSQNSKKETKKAPQKTAKEKKQAKREKRG